MPTVSEMAVILNQRIVEDMKRSAKAMPEGKITWQPLDEGRTVLDQIIECGTICRFIAKTLSDVALPTFDDAMRQRMEAFKTDNDTLDKALNHLQTGFEALNAAIEGFPAEHLDETVTLPFGGGMVRSFAELMFLSYWNATYHFGQINYIQTLYGDKEMH